MKCFLDLLLSRTPFPYNNGKVRRGPKAELTGGTWSNLQYVATPF